MLFIEILFINSFVSFVYVDVYFFFHKKYYLLMKFLQTVYKCIQIYIKRLNEAFIVLQT